MPGRLMVGRMALDHVVKVRVLPGQFSIIIRTYAFPFKVPLIRGI